MSVQVQTKHTTLIPPYGGELVNLLVPDSERESLKAYAGTLPSIQLTPRSVCDLELLANGGFSPLRGFMGQADYQRVLDEMRLVNGTLFPIPITLPVEPAEFIAPGNAIALRNNKNELLAVLEIEEVYEWDVDEAAQKVFGSTDTAHPLVAEMHRWGKLNIAGNLRVLQLPTYYDFRDLRLTP